MREQLIQYVNLLFAGAPDSEDIKQEILQNTLDRFDDLVSQGKSPEAAYRLAISGIGDINEVLGTAPATAQTQTVKEAIHEEVEDIRRKKLRAVAIALYILCAIPVILFGEANTEFVNVLGLCLTLVMVAFATYLIIITGKKDADDDEIKERAERTPQQVLKKSIGSLIWAIGLALYFIVSFVSGAWYITWIIFPIMACVRGLVNAIIDLKEASKHEN